ncbi:MAG: ABC transporter permease subunit [Deferribacterota bacterium]|nr:ABC transporter permease subunit [Deferribacterota bacterium]
MKLIKTCSIFAIILALCILILISTSFILTNVNSFLLLLKDKNFIDALMFGIKTSVLATIFSALFGIPSGLYLAREKNKFSRLLDSLFDIPLIIPPLVVGTLLLIFFNIPYIINILNVIFTFKGAVIAQFFISFPFTVKAAKNAFELIPTTYEHIAMTLGASQFRAFYDTTFKLAFNSVLGGLILSWLRSLGEFGATLMIGGGISGVTANIPIYIYLNMNEGDFQKGLSASLLIVLFAFICVITLKIIFAKKSYYIQ